MRLLVQLADVLLEREGADVSEHRQLQVEVPRPINPAREQCLTDEQAEPEWRDGGSGKPSCSAPRRVAVRRSTA